MQRNIRVHDYLYRLNNIEYVQKNFLKNLLRQFFSSIIKTSNRYRLKVYSLYLMITSKKFVKNKASRKIISCN